MEWLLDESDGSLLRVNPRTGRPSGAPVTLETASESGLAIGRDAAWVTDPEAQVVTRVGF